MRNRTKYILLLFSFAFLLFSQKVHAQFEGGVKDSLRVLCVKYDTCGAQSDGLVCISFTMECDTLKMPTFMVGDSIVQFVSDINVEKINSVQFLYGKTLTKKLAKAFPTGLIAVTLKDGEDYNTCQAIPEGNNLTRKALVTRISLNDFNNKNGEFSQKISELIDLCGTDDAYFRQYKYLNMNRATPILAIDSLEKKALVQSFNDFRPGAIADVIMYSSEEAQKIIGDKGVNGLVVAVIDSKHTLAEALMSPVEKLERTLNEMIVVNFRSLLLREPMHIE